MNANTNTNTNDNSHLIKEIIDNSENTWRLWDYSIDTESLLTDTCDDELTAAELLRLALEGCVDFNEVVSDRLERYLETDRMPAELVELLPEDWHIHCEGNTFNEENDLSQDFAYAIVSPHAESDWCWNREPIYLIVARLTGGDPRCIQNYAPAQVFLFDSFLADTYVLDWKIGWELQEIGGDSELQFHEFHIGYHSSPTSALEDSLEGLMIQDHHDWTNDRILGVIDDIAYELWPYCHAGEITKN